MKKQSISKCIIHKDVTSALMTNYCKSIDSYSRPMQDAFNEMALKAIESGIDVDILSLGDTEKKKFSSLLSDMFMREWHKVREDGKDMKGNQILTLVLTWSPFRQFVKSLCKKNYTCILYYTVMFIRQL